MRELMKKIADFREMLALWLGNHEVMWNDDLAAIHRERCAGTNGAGRDISFDDIHVVETDGQR